MIPLPPQSAQSALDPAPASLWNALRTLPAALKLDITRLTWLACGLTILAVAAFVWDESQSDLMQIKAEMDIANSLNAKGYAKFVTLNLSMVDRELTELRALQVSGLKLPPQPVLDARLKVLGGLLLQVAVADADGRVVDSSLGPLTAAVSIADRPHFLAVKNNPLDMLFISQPVFGRVSQKMSLQLVRPLLTPDGRFNGAIVASIDPERLKAYFTDLNALHNQGVLTILGTDGMVRFRLNAQGFSAGQDFRVSPRWKEVTTRSSGFYEQPGFIDGVNRRMAYQQVEDYPLVVVVGTGLQSQLRSFTARWTLAWSLALALAAVLAIVAASVTRLARAQRSAMRLLEQNRLQAMEASQAKSNFLASVSHELRTPLNSILGFSELIRDTSSEPKISQYAGLIHQSGSHLHALVNTILDLTKIESGKMGVTLETIDLPQLLGSLTSIHKVNADQKMLSLSLSLSVDEAVQGVVTSDRTKLVQVLNNVMHNAIKFTPSGAISVRLKPAGTAGVQISVIDTGIGIAASDIGQVFERFNTIAAPVDGTSCKGSGLGLALCRELLSLMGGTIDLVSEAGCGTTVNIFIPYKISLEGAVA